MTQSALSGAFWPILALWLVSGLVLLGGDAARLALRYDRGGLEALEAYRLLTGHVVHLGASHFLLNALGMVLVGLLVGQAFRAEAWWLVIAASVATIDSMFWFLHPELSWYVGLSGVLHGMLLAGAIALWPARRLESAVIVAAVAAKLVFEQVVGPLPGSESSSGGDVVVDAHLYGAIGGALVAVILAGLRRHTPV